MADLVLTGFMNKEDYTKVIEETHLSNGLVWSIPITLPVTESEADKLEIGDDIALYGEDGQLYGTLKLEEKYTYDKEKRVWCTELLKKLILELKRFMKKVIYI